MDNGGVMGFDVLKSLQEHQSGRGFDSRRLH